MRKPGWLLSPSFCLDAISLSFNIFIHSLLFSFISQLILFIICPYLQAWQSILHSASADRWKNDPCLTLPSITSLLPSLLSSWSPSETRLTGCYISSSHSNPPPHPILTSSWQSFFSTVRALCLACSTSLSRNNWGWDKREGTFSQTVEDRKESEYSPSLQAHRSQPFSSDFFCPQWVHLSADTVQSHTFTLPYISCPPHTHYPAVSHGDSMLTRNTMYIQNCWWLLFAYRAWRRTQGSKQRHQSTQQVTTPFRIPSLQDMHELSEKQE